MRRLTLLATLIGCSTPPPATSSPPSAPTGASISSASPDAASPADTTGAAPSAAAPPPMPTTSMMGPSPAAPTSASTDPETGDPEAGDTEAGDTEAELTLDDGCGPCCPVEILYVTSTEPSLPAREAGEPVAAAYRGWRDCIGFVADSVSWRAQLVFEVDHRGRGRLVKVAMTPPRPEVGACLAKAWPDLRWPPRPGGKRARIAASYRRMAAHGHPPP